MGKDKKYKLNFRRRREKKTNYDKRYSLLKSKKPRVVVRKSNKFILIQLIEYKEKGDKILASAFSKNLMKFGWNKSKKNLPAAYLIGLLFGLKAKNISEKAIIDFGFKKIIKKNFLFALLKGINESGMKIDFNKSFLPEEERIEGKHINAVELFKAVKNRIMEGEKK